MYSEGSTIVLQLRQARGTLSKLIAKPLTQVMPILAESLFLSRLRELPSATRSSKEAISRNLGPTFLSNSVHPPYFN